MMTSSLPARPDKEKWAAMKLTAQMANIGSEVGRTLKWKQKGNLALAKSAFIRAIDLFDLTVEVGRCNESPFLRDSLLRELLLARCQFCKEYLSEDTDAIAASDRYFSQFAKAYARRRDSSTSVL